MEAILYNPHPNQRIIHDSINGGEYKYYILNIGRQFGKSLLAMNQCLYWAINYSDVKIAWVSPIYKQAKKVFNELVKAFENTEVYQKIDRQELKITFYNGSTIEFFSSERYDNIRGFTFDYLVCDEFAFQDEQAWTEVLRATVLVKGKKVLLISTPRGKNHFYRLHQLGGNDPKYKSFTMTSYDNNKIDPKEIDNARDTLPDAVFRQEYLAEFIDGGASLFNGLACLDGEVTDRLTAGIDVGRANDYTVLTILNNKGQMVFADRWRQMDWSDIVKHVAEKLIEYNADTLIEVNSIGDAVYEQLLKEVNGRVSIEPFTTTSKSKKDILEQLMVACQNKEFSITNTEWLKKEFDAFTFEWNPKSRTVKYSAPVGLHDDGVMSSAIAYQAYKQYGMGGRYMIS